MMLTLYENIASQMRTVLEKELFGCNATIGHDQHAGLAENGELNNEGLVVSPIAFEEAWWKKDLRFDLRREIELVSRGAKSARISVSSELRDQSPMNRRPVR